MRSYPETAVPALKHLFEAHGIWFRVNGKDNGNYRDYRDCKRFRVSNFFGN